MTLGIWGGGGSNCLLPLPILMHCSMPFLFCPPFFSPLPSGSHQNWTLNLGLPPLFKKKDSLHIFSIPFSTKSSNHDPKGLLSPNCAQRTNIFRYFVTWSTSLLFLLLYLPWRPHFIVVKLRSEIRVIKFSPLTHKNDLAWVCNSKVTGSLHNLVSCIQHFTNITFSWGLVLACYFKICVRKVSLLQVAC